MYVHMYKNPYIYIYYIFTFSHIYLLYLCSAIISAVIHCECNAQLYIYSLFSFLYASDTFLPITTYRYHRQPSLSMHKQRDGPKVVKSRQGDPSPGQWEDFATVWHRPDARRDITTSFSSRNLTVLSSLPFNTICRASGVSVDRYSPAYTLHNIDHFDNIKICLKNFYVHLFRLFYLFIYYYSLFYIIFYHYYFILSLWENFVSTGIPSLFLRLIN